MNPCCFKHKTDFLSFCKNNINHFQMAIKRTLCHRLIYLVFLIVFSPNSLCKGAPDHLADTEDSLSVLFNQLYPGYSMKKKRDVNEKIIKILKPVLKQPVSFFYSFDSVQQMGTIISPDSTIKLYTWNVPLEGGVHEYYGFIQQYNGDDACKVFQLHDRLNAPGNLSQDQYCHDNWYGMLYYDIIPVTRENKKYYTLLGLDYNNLVTSKKIVDILYFNPGGTPCFGAPLISIDDTLQNRFVLEYSSKIVISLKYKKTTRPETSPEQMNTDDIQARIQQEILRQKNQESPGKKIIFDHLIPVNPKFKGNYGYYGPGGTYDALIFKNGIWNYFENINPMD